jgi:serine/threonine protein phosphatase PrpC
MSPPVALRAFALTHRGLVRRINEDAIAVAGWIGQTDMEAPQVFDVVASLSAPAAFVVADGLGGHPAGDVASRLAAERIAGHASATGLEPSAAARALCIDAHAHLHEHMDVPPGRRTMGATVAGVLAAGDHCAIFNVGDSRVYRVQDGFLHQLTIDDSDPGDHAVDQCLGGTLEHEHVFPHVVAEQWLPGRRYLVCSDGLTRPLAIDAIEGALTLPGPQAVALLLQMTLDAGAPDNVSIVLVERA